jgi:HEAT repeat-containing protein 5
MHFFSSSVSVQWLFICILFCEGICIEALCNPTSVQPLETVNMCLKAMSTLLDDSWTRTQLGSDQQLAIEILNVLHR